MLKGLHFYIVAPSICIVITIMTFVGLFLLHQIDREITQQIGRQLTQSAEIVSEWYATEQRSLESLALLTAQRPTLHELLSAPTIDQPALTDYLDLLRQGSKLDLLIICSDQGVLIDSVGMQATHCPPLDNSLFTVDNRHWLISQTPHSTLPYFIIVGTALNDSFAQYIADRTGMIHTIWHKETLIGASVPLSLRANLRLNWGQPIISLQGKEYAWQTEQLGNGISTQLYANITDLLQVKELFRRVVLGSFLFATMTISIGMIVVSRRITRPLADLQSGASRLRIGALDRPITVTSSIQEISSLAGTIEHARLTLHQMLERLQREQAWNNELMENIVEGIVVVDEQDQIIYANSSSFRIMEWPITEMLGRKWADIFPNEPSDPLPQRRMKTRTRNNHSIILSLTSAELLAPENGQRQRIYVFRDVTEEETVRRWLAQFSANITHEFRTPLASLEASVELLLDQVDSLTVAELCELLESLHVGIWGLQTLIDNLLESASLETGHFKIATHPCDLYGIIVEADRIMHPLLTKHGQHLILNIPPTIPPVQIDHRRIVQVLVNLISNASKYGPDDAPIELRVTELERQILVEVIDRGVGVDSADAGHLFERFVQHSPTPPASGMGLGLAIVKAIVEAHHGTAQATNSPQSIFWFTLPKVSDYEDISRG